MELDVEQEGKELGALTVRLSQDYDWDLSTSRCLPGPVGVGDRVTATKLLQSISESHGPLVITLSEEIPRLPGAPGWCLDYCT